jgi:cytochrome c biogenesis protein CcmG/thiol:disulfide interchange protein DsbE
MKKLILLALVALSFQAIAQTGRTVPSVSVKKLDGTTIDTKDLNNNGKPMIINFWATWCAPCVKELNTIADEYPTWVKETGVKMVAVSIDDARNSAKVKPFVDAKGWEYEIILDPNSDFKRALGVNNPPMTFLVDGKGNIVWTHTGYAPGDEDELYEEVQKLK